jgi:hypothetical protein
MLWAGAAAALCAAVFVLPAPRAAAQRLWDQVVLGRIQVWTVDAEGPGAAAFFAPQIVHTGETRPVESSGAASSLAGFEPRLPGLDVFATPPAFSVADVTTAGVRLQTPAIRHLVARAGASAAEVPDSWDGVDLELRVGPVIIADYGGILLLQSLPPQIIKPADFDLELFYRLAFRALGISDTDARVLSADLMMSPALLMFMPEEDRELLHEFDTRHGKGLMIHEVYGPGSITAVWSGSDRMYALYPSGGQVTRELVTRVAEALE